MWRYVVIMALGMGILVGCNDKTNVDAANSVRSEVYSGQETVVIVYTKHGMPCAVRPGGIGGIDCNWGRWPMSGE